MFYSLCLQFPKFNAIVYEKSNKMLEFFGGYKPKRSK